MPSGGAAHGAQANDARRLACACASRQSAQNSTREGLIGPSKAATFRFWTSGPPNERERETQGQRSNVAEPSCNTQLVVPLSRIPITPSSSALCSCCHALTPSPPRRLRSVPRTKASPVAGSGKTAGYRGMDPVNTTNRSRGQTVAGFRSTERTGQSRIHEHRANWGEEDSGPPSAQGRGGTEGRTGNAG